MYFVACVSGCQTASDSEPHSQFLKRAKVAIRPEILDQYTGTYVLPSGALFPVFRDENRLMAGIPPSELLPQTTREFASNQIFAEMIFERVQRGPAPRVNIRAAKQDMWARRADASDVPDPTQMVDAGGHRLRMLVTGNEGPTIVIEDGFGSSILMRAKLQAELSEFARVVTYDHAGTGGSEPGPHPRHARQIAVELRTALRNARIEPPFILVGGSIGADYISVFAHAYPQSVAGLVRLDPTPDWDAIHVWMKTHAPSRADAFQPQVSRAHVAIPEMMKHQAPGRQAEWKSIAETRQLARDALPLPNIPVVQITGAAGHQTNRIANDKVRFFDDWLEQHVPHAKHVLAKKSGHAVYAFDPELVVDEIRQLVDRIRADADSKIQPPGTNDLGLHELIPGS